MQMILYMIFYIAGTTSAIIACGFGFFHWKKLEVGYKILALLILAGVVIDLSGLLYIVLGINANKLPLYINDALQLTLFFLVLMRISDGIISQRLYWFLLWNAVVYAILWFGVLYFAPQWFDTPYIATMTYLWIVIMTLEVTIQFRIHSALFSTTPATWVFVGIIVYSAAIDVLLLQKSVLPQSNPSLFWISHGVIAMFKNICLFHSFRLVSWNFSART